MLEAIKQRASKRFAYTSVFLFIKEELPETQVKTKRPRLRNTIIPNMLL
jgi:hypothetical protein